MPAPARHFAPQSNGGGEFSQAGTTPWLSSQRSLRRFVSHLREVLGPRQTAGYSAFRGRGGAANLPAAMEADSAQPLRENWYFALPGTAVPRGRMRAKTLLGEPLLICRGSDGGVFALRDICPHRGIPLSCGRFDGQEVECCYHGWRFDGAGRCTAIPSLVPEQDFDVARIKVKAYPAREVQGNIWIYFGEDPAGAPAVPVLPDIGERAPDLFESMRFPCAIDHAVVGLMDPAHGPFVHRAWWWRGRHSIHEKAKAFAPSPFGFTMLRHAPSRNSNAYRLLGGKPETEITFHLPSVRNEHIRDGRHADVNLTAETPLSERESEVNHANYWTQP